MQPLRFSGHALVVGTGEPARDLQDLLAAAGWRCRHLETTAGVLAGLRREHDADVVLFVPGPDLRPYTELCRHIKFDARTAFLSVIFALTPTHSEQRAAVFAAGADECIQLPAERDEILPRLTNACRMKRTIDSLEDSTAVITSLANAIEGRDAYTRGHVERVSTYSVEIGRRLGLSAADLAALRTGGVVHDIGKVAVPDQILNKPGKLTDEEMTIVRRHPVVGHDILQPLRTFHHVLAIVRWHHERPNGTGYPDGLAAENLPQLPRIIAVADVFDALSTARSYRPAFAPERCRAIMAEAAQRGELDAELVRILFDILDESALALAAAAEPTGPTAAH